MDDQTDIKFIKQQEFNANIVKRLEELEDLSGQFDIAGRLLRNDNQILRKEFEEFKDSTLIRLDQEIENRTKAFERIKELEDYNETYNEKHQTNKNYSFQRRIEKLEDYRVKTSLELERIEDILVVHRDQDNTQRKNYKALRDVWDKTVLKIIEKGKHGEQK